MRVPSLNYLAVDGTLNTTNQPIYFTSKVYKLHQVDLVLSVSASSGVDRGFAPRLGHTKDHHKMVQIASLFDTQCLRVGVWQCSPTVLKAW